MFCTLKAVGVDFGQRVGCGGPLGGGERGVVHWVLGVLSCTEGGMGGCVQ